MNVRFLQVSQSKQVIELSASWNSIITFISKILAVVVNVFAVIGTICAVLTFFYGSVTIKDTAGTIGCNGFLIQDPPSEMLMIATLSKKENAYLEEKINCSRDQIQKNPKDAVAYTNIGEAERRLGNLTAARKAHQKALYLNPNLQEAKIGLALVEEDMGHEIAASQTMQGALALNPNGIAYLYQGVILHKQNDLKGAETAWRTAKKLDPMVQRVIRTWRLFNFRMNWSLLF